MSVFFTRRGTAKRIHYVDCLQTAGTQWFDTEFKPNQNTRIVMDFEITDAAGSTGLAAFGTRQSYDTQNLSFVWDISGAFWMHNYGNIHTNKFTPSTPVGRYVLDINKQVCTLNGTELTCSASTFSCGYSLYLFALNQAGTAQWFPKGRLYSCQIYDNGSLIRDYWPCYDPDGVVCLYDRIRQSYSYNRGSGTPIAVLAS